MFKYILIPFLLILSLHAQENLTKKSVTLVLPWKHQFQFAGYYMAKEMGFYKEAGLEVDIKEFDLKRDNSIDVASLKYEFGVGHSSLILDRLNTYPNIILLNAIHQSSPLILLTKKRPDIKSIKEIVNKKIMMSSDQTYTASINAMLFSEKIEANSFEVLETSFNPLDLINGNADLMVAYLSNEPYFLAQKGIDYTIFNPIDYGYNFYSDILFTSKEMLEKHPKRVNAFREASLKGWIYAYAHIDETVEIILKKYNTQNRTKEALLFEARTLQKLAFKDGVNFGDINPIRVQEIITTYRLLGLIKSSEQIDFNDFIYLGDTSAKTILHINKIRKNVLLALYREYQEYIIIAMLLFIVIFLSSLYFRYKSKLLLKRQALELAKNFEIFDNNISSSKTDLEGNITYVSKEFCRVTGYTKEELIGNNHRILKSEDDLSQTDYKDLWITIKSGHTWRNEIKNIKKDGSDYWAAVVISPIYDTENKIVAYESIRQDITLNKTLEEFNVKLEEEVKKKTKKLTLLSITDKLTGIYNRVKLDDDLDSNFNYYQKYKEVFSVIILDIDLFKNVNDTYGHQVGDDILKEITEVMKTLVRSTDTLGRWGGEEFMLICPNTTKDGAYKLAQNIRAAVEAHKFPRVTNLSISAGVCEIQEDKSIHYLVSCADKALYKAKELGRNRVEI